MTVRDIITQTHDYQDYELIIKSFGDCKILYRHWFPSDEDISKIKCNYLDSEIAAIVFNCEKLSLIIEQKE